MIRISIPGRPKAKARPRFGCGRAFPDKKTVLEEKRLREAFREKWPYAPLQGPLLLGLRFRMPAPQKADPWREQAAAMRLWWPPARTDLDNLEKLTKDAANGHLWLDDSQVVCALKIKVEDPEPGTDIIVASVPHVLSEDVFRAVDLSAVEPLRQRLAVEAVWGMLCE